MTDKPMKCRLIRANGEEMPLAWNVNDYEHHASDGFLHLWHEKGEVIHQFAPGDTVVMLEQFCGQRDSDHEDD